MTLDLAAYLSLTFALVITPGASTVLVLRNTVKGGWRLGLATALGVALGNVTVATAARLGLALLFQRWPIVLAILQWAGALYLGWLGIASLRRSLRGETSLEAALHAEGHHRWTVAFGQGVTVNLLNPPVSIFYLVVVPTFMPAGAGWTRFATLAAIHVTMAFVCHMGWAFLFDRLREFVRRPGPLRILEAGAGVALVYLAVRTVMRS